MSDNITRILPNWLIWTFSVSGVIFLKFNEYKYLKFILIIIFHGFFVWNFIQSHEFMKRSSKDFNTDVKRVMLAINLIVVVLKCMWGILYSPKFNRLLNDLSHQYVSMISYNNYNNDKRLVGSYILFVFVYMFFISLSKMIFLESFGNAFFINWVISSHRHALESEFLAIILGRTKELFLGFNYNLTQELNDTVCSMEIRRLSKHSARNEIPMNRIMQKIDRLRSISLHHYLTLDSFESLSMILSSSIFMWLMINITETIYALFFFVSLVVSNQIDFRTSSWMLLELMKIGYVIFNWSSLSQEANKSVIILHDIWNKYAENNKIEGQLYYLQFLSLRFRTSKVKFTAYGFFALDWTFLHTVLALATTYIVILIQLRS